MADRLTSGLADVPSGAGDSVPPPLCGRFTSSMPKSALRERFEVDAPEEWSERFNLAPTQKLLAIRRREGERQSTLLRWGLVPHWAKDLSPSYKMINARAETLLEKPAYRSLLHSRRCLILADGFYEWQLIEARKQPIRFALAGGEPFAFAGLWTAWTDKASGEIVESATIITTRVNDVVAPVHGRMPVILARDVEELWLDPDADADAAISILKPYPARLMVARAASPDVNSIRNDYRELVQHAAA